MPKTAELADRILSIVAEPGFSNEKGLCQYVADMINDPDLKGGNAFRHYLVDLDAKGIGADWDDWL